MALDIIIDLTLLLLLYRLGLIMNARMFYKFYGKDLEDARAFEARIDLLTRELGDRGKPPSPAVLPTGACRGQASSTAPDPTLRTGPACTLAPPPAQPAAPSQVAQTPGQNSVPSMQQPDVTTNQWQPASMEVIAFMTEQVKQQQAEIAKLREENVKAKIQAAKAEIEAEIHFTHQLLALQTRLEVMHEAKLLDGPELHAIEDIIADAAGVANDKTVCALIRLSGQMATNKSFARQIKRKFVS